MKPETITIQGNEELITKLVNNLPDGCEEYVQRTYMTIFNEIPDVYKIYRNTSEDIENILKDISPVLDKHYYINPEAKVSKISSRIVVTVSTLIYIDYSNKEIFIAGHKGDKEFDYIVQFLLELQELPPVKDKSKHFYICGINEGSLTLIAHSVAPTTVDIELYYGEEFVPKYDKIIDTLSEAAGKGVVLFHGIPGSGKTTLIRHLIEELSDTKKIIYLPPDMAHSISSPHFITFLSKHRDSILIIEDAENVLKIRSESANQAMANLLNLSDGLLSDVLAIQIICTFNCHLSQIDPALLRKGRLIAIHEFDKIPVERAIKICEKYGIAADVTEDIVLSDLFNQSE